MASRLANELDLSNIVASVNEQKALRINVCAHDSTAEMAIIANNVGNWNTD